MEQPRIVFMGSPEIAAPLFRALAERYPIVGVVTQPDRPTGRGKKAASPAVKLAAEAAGIPVFQPERLRRPEAFEVVAGWEPDLIVVMAYGQILRQPVLDLPRYGCINVHASILPRWRGASPIQAAIAAGDERTGVSMMRMDAGMDTGAVYSVHETAIAPDDTAESLSAKIAALAAEALISDLPRILSGELRPTAQPETGVTLTGLIKKEDGRLDFTREAVVLERLVRAYDPWPSAFLELDGATLKILRARIGPEDSGSRPGARVRIGKEPAVKAADRFLILDEVQPAGKKPMSGRAFLGGYRNWSPDGLEGP